MLTRGVIPEQTCFYQRLCTPSFSYFFMCISRAISSPKLTKIGTGKIPVEPLEAITLLSGGFPGGSVVKNPLANAGDSGSIPGRRKSPGVGNSNPLQYFCLGNPWTEESVGCKEFDTTEHARTLLSQLERKLDWCWNQCYMVATSYTWILSTWIMVSPGWDVLCMQKRCWILDSMWKKDCKILINIHNDYIFLHLFITWKL